MEIDENASYQLTKMSRLNNNPFMVDIGMTARGPASIQEIGGEKRLHVGRFADYIVTSPIVEWNDEGNGVVMVTTKNSVYKLEKINVTNNVKEN